MICSASIRWIAPVALHGEPSSVTAEVQYRPESHGRGLIDTILSYCQISQQSIHIGAAHPSWVTRFNQRFILQRPLGCRVFTGSLLPSVIRIGCGAVLSPARSALFLILQRSPQPRKLQDWVQFVKGSPYFQRWLPMGCIFDTNTGGNHFNQITGPLPPLSNRRQSQFVIGISALSPSPQPSASTRRSRPPQSSNSSHFSSDCVGAKRCQLPTAAT